MSKVYAADVDVNVPMSEWGHSTHETFFVQIVQSYVKGGCSLSK